MKNFPALFAVTAGLLFSSFASHAEEAKPAAAKETLGSTIVELHKKGFNTLVAAITNTEFSDKLENGTYTVLAPTDVAFRDLPKPQLDALLADKEKLTSLLSRHIIEGKVSTADLKSGKVKTLGGTTVGAKMIDGKLKIGAATVVRADLPSANGAIHGVDKFLP